MSEEEEPQGVEGEQAGLNATPEAEADAAGEGEAAADGSDGVSGLCILKQVLVCQLGLVLHLLQCQQGNQDGSGACIIRTWQGEVGGMLHAARRRGAHAHRSDSVASQPCPALPCSGG